MRTIPDWDSPGLGVTTCQMLNAAIGATYVWPNDALYYPKSLASYLGRADLDVQPRWWLSYRTVCGSKPVEVVVDHYCNLSEENLEAAEALRFRGINVVR